MAPASALLVTFLLLPAAFAQTTRSVEADIPFGFHAGGKVLPAGEYRVSPAGRGAALVRGTDGRRASAVIVNSAGGGTIRQSTVLVFQRYGDQYFLKQVWCAGDAYGMEVPKSSQEDAAIFRAGNHSERVSIVAFAVR